VKSMYIFYHFPVENVGFNEYAYRIRAWTVYFANTQFKRNFEDPMGV